MNKITITRTQYMNSLPKYGTAESKDAHRAFYAQFVTPATLELVESRIGLKAIQSSNDPHFNDIPLAKWDAIWIRRIGNRMRIYPGAIVEALLKEAGENNSASTGVCILKEAAQQIKERKAELPAFRVTYADGYHYVTSMAHGITLADAYAYFIGQVFTRSDETKPAPVVSVEQV